jgi:hypothetical protein
MEDLNSASKIRIISTSRFGNGLRWSAGLQAEIFDNRIENEGGTRAWGELYGLEKAESLILAQNQRWRRA